MTRVGIYGGVFREGLLEDMRLVWEQDRKAASVSLGENEQWGKQNSQEGGISMSDAGLQVCWSGILFPSTSKLPSTQVVKQVEVSRATAFGLHYPYLVFSTALN